MDRARSRGVSLVLLTPLALACATVPPPTDTINAANRAIIEATQANAEPYARLEMHLAREHTEQANAAMKAGRHAEARDLAEKALVEAELAEAKAAAARATQNVEEIRDYIAMLKREIGRASGAGR